MPSNCEVLEACRFAEEVARLKQIELFWSNHHKLSQPLKPEICFCPKCQSFIQTDNLSENFAPRTIETQQRKIKT